MQAYKYTKLLYHIELIIIDFNTILLKIWVLNILWIRWILSLFIYKF